MDLYDYAYSLCRPVVYTSTSIHIHSPKIEYGGDVIMDIYFILLTTAYNYNLCMYITIVFIYSPGTRTFSPTLNPTPNLTPSLTPNPTSNSNPSSTPSLAPNASPSLTPSSTFSSTSRSLHNGNKDHTDNGRLFHLFTLVIIVCVVVLYT